jgi:hypothetical protein
MGILIDRFVVSGDRVPSTTVFMRSDNSEPVLDAGGAVKMVFSTFPATRLAQSGKISHNGSNIFVGEGHINGSG